MTTCTKCQEVEYNEMMRWLESMRRIKQRAESRQRLLKATHPHNNDVAEVQNTTLELFCTWIDAEILKHRIRRS
jgi:hypothetical protein